MDKPRIVHDINSNLQIVINFLKLLELKYPDGEAREFIDITVNATKKIKILLIDLIKDEDSKNG